MRIIANPVSSVHTRRQHGPLDEYRREKNVPEYPVAMRKREMYRAAMFMVEREMM